MSTYLLDEDGDFLTDESGNRLLFDAIFSVTTPSGFTQKPTTQKGYEPVPSIITDPLQGYRILAAALNRTMGGKMNATFDVTLTPSGTTTNVTDSRIGATSFLQFMPMTSSAATALANGIHVSDQKAGSAVLNHASAADTDQDLRVLVIG